MFENIKNKINKKYLLILIVAIFLVIIGYSINPIISYFEKKQIDEINDILSDYSREKTIDDCKKIMTFDKTKVWKNNSFFNEITFDTIFNECSLKYDLKNIELNLDNCKTIIKETNSYFKSNYVFFETLEEKRLVCSEKYLNPTFSIGNYFNINNDFKTSIHIDSALDLFTDVGEENSEVFLKNREEVKLRFQKLISIEPKVEIAIDDIFLYKNKIILNLNLEPLKEYKIKLNSFDTTIGEKTEKKEFIFTTPENKYFGMKVINPLSIYTKENLPTFQILDYNTPKTTTKIRLCKVPEETYAKLEVLSDTQNKDFSNSFFKNYSTSLKTYECIEKDIIVKDNSLINQNKLVKKDFSFKDLVGENDPKGMYMLSFLSESDIEFNSRINKPIFFSIVNSHIIMKVSKSGEGFFFVTDFLGNPLPDQEIGVYLNDFEEIQKNYNRETYDYDITYNSVIEKNVYSEKIILGKTDATGVLKVDLKGKINDYFDRTFEDERSYDWNKMYKSFLVKSTGGIYQSYLVSTWNSGIAPWNFGYKTDYSYDENDIFIDRWGENREYFAHIYTDRKLYLPGEQVNLKTIIRKSEDLSIPKLDQIFILKISNSKGEDILEKEIKVNEYGSYSETLNLRSDFPLGTYNVYLSSEGKTIYYYSFDVEVFKNPKFKNELMLKTSGLTNSLVDIKETTKEQNYYYETEVYKGDFSINAEVISTYFSGPRVKNAPFEYKVYKQAYYGDDYWDDCYYGCYWEPEKEFYTSGTGVLDASGTANLDIKVDFSSSYSDYKYIVEVSVTDSAGDTISGSNSIIAKLPEEYKKYNNSLSLNFESKDRFLKVGERFNIIGKLSNGKWSDSYNDKYVFVIKRKEYSNKIVKDVNGYDRNISQVSEIIEKVMYVNDKNFKINGVGNLELSYKIDKNSEYIFEYASIDNYYVGEFLGLNQDEIIEKKYLDEIVNKFDSEKSLYIENYLETPKQDCVEGEICNNEIITKRLYLRDFISRARYLPLISYSDLESNNPIENDNKLRVLSEKVSYKIGETARVLVRLPVSNSKILWTIEKSGVTHYEYIEVPGNIFFKEFSIDESFAPNSYIGVAMIDTKVGGEYKVGYTEIVVDKSDKKSFIDIKTNKQTYKPREQVKVDLLVKDAKGKPLISELTLMVVDDSLISLMGNVDLNTLEKIFIKLPFSIQTSITNIGMIKNYYFSRLGIVGGSGYGDFKGGDSAVSTRNIFKNTAYFNPSIITDGNGKASVTFTLPDNLTNFRIMAVSNSKTNNFGYSENNIEVRKEVVLEDKTPQILRDGDQSIISANLFNNTDKDIDFKVDIKTIGVEVTDPEKKLTLKAKESKNISWKVKANSSVDEIVYTISALGDSAINSDKIENKIQIKKSPVLINQVLKSGIIESYGSLNLESFIGKNTDKNLSNVELVFSNSRLSGIEKIVSSLYIYPYGCIEQTTSSTIPNVIIKQFSNLFADLFDEDKVEKSINYGIDRIYSMQVADGGFAYWQGNSSSDLHITPYVLRSLLYMKKSGIKIQDKVIENAISYLEKNLENASDDVQKSEIFWALKSAGKNPNLVMEPLKLDRHSLIAYTYGLVLSDKKDTELIKSNIELIKKKITQTDSNWYWDTTSDKAIFASLLLDLKDSTYDSYIESLIADLYLYDWSSYYYSTQSKNNAFIAFYKYLEKNKLNSKTNFSFRLGNFSDNKKYNLGGDNLAMLKLNYNLANVSSGDNLNLSVGNNSENKIFVDFVLKEYPLDVTKIEPYTNGMTVKREIYKVKDENLLLKCSNTYYYYEKNKVNCDSVFEKVNGNNFELGKLYKTRITVDFTDNKSRRNLTIEDYLPGSFRVINSKFKTESASVTGSTRNWSWDYVENKPDVVMANASYIWGKNAEYEYFFRPEFAGTYTYPPVSAYLMYDPVIRANSKFNIIEVK
ncbi:MAG: alpha-2-macroglobulin family protein [Candidatus Gracilibacteria bacterium]|nr:alpha-2-macroglobulin family protein [Candidatus Gracilibacteria bacterium]